MKREPSLVEPTLVDRKHGPQNEPPNSLCIGLLPDHLGFNEPASSLRSRTRIKRLASQTREDNARFFDGIDQVPTHCVTQGLGTVQEARRLVLIATGSHKADAIAAAVEGPLSASCPGSVLQLHPDAVVVLDEAAAAGLKNRAYYDDAAAGLQFGI